MDSVINRHGRGTVVVMVKLVQAVRGTVLRRSIVGMSVVPIGQDHHGIIVAIMGIMRQRRRVKPSAKHCKQEQEPELDAPHDPALPAAT
jgi:hypothetical protein